MSDWKWIFGMAIIVILVGSFFVACNADLCGNKGGHLTISLLSSAGYACVDEEGHQIPIP